MASRTPATLWTQRLPATTVSPGRSAGASIRSTQEGGAVDRAVQHHRRDQALGAQGAQEGGGALMPMRRRADQALAVQAAPARAGHGRGGAVQGSALTIEEHQLARVELGRGLRPGAARFGHVGAVLLGRAQPFF